MKRRKKNILTLISSLLLIAGMIVILYPYICQYLYRIESQQLIREFDEQIAGYDREAGGDIAEKDNLDWLYELMVNYNETLYQEAQKKLIDPFSYQQVNFSLIEFGFDEEMIGYLNIPKMNVELPIYLGASEENLKKGAVHLTETSLPVGGVNTNAVIAGHRGYSGGAMFRDIERLELGDEITITNFRETLVYRVVEIVIILPTDIDKVLIQEGRDLVTLITCHPYRFNYQRYVVYCERMLPY